MIWPAIANLRRTTLWVASFVGAILWILGLETPGVAIAMTDPTTPWLISEDVIARPPLHQEMVSPRGTYILILRGDPDWATKQLTATLYRVSDRLCEPQWTQTLPQEYGPRFVIVNDQGQIALLDEWINVASPYAVMVLDAQGNPVQQFHFDQVAAQLGVPRADIVEAARYGWWITEPPTLREDGQTVQVKTAGKVLDIDLSSGQLSVSPPS